MNSFFDGRLFKDYLDELKAEIKHKIDDEFDSNLDEDEFCEYIISTYVISEIIIDERKIVKLPARETIRHRNFPIFNESVEIPAIQITIEIPFQGPREYLTFKPSSRLLGMNPKGRIFEDRIHLYFESSDSNPQHLNNRIKNTIDEVLTNYKNILNEIKKFNENLDQYIRFMIRKRGERMAQIKEFVKSIDFPLQKREEVPPTIPIKRRRIVIEKPVPSKKIKEPYSVIALHLYEEILSICVNMALAMERSPDTFERLTEPQIRDFFLVMLNAFFKGKATAETFNKEGKTDILIRVENNNVLIVECKIWRGKKILETSIDQLFNYTTWRDTKTAIFIFNKEKGVKFSTLLRQIDSIIKNHSNYKEEYHFKNENLRGEGLFGYIFNHPEDEDRRIYLTIMAFNIPELKDNT